MSVLIPMGLIVLTALTCFFGFKVFRFNVASLIFTSPYESTYLRRSTLIVLCTFGLGLLFVAVPLQKAYAQCEVSKLISPLADGYGVGDFRISADGTHVVYIVYPSDDAPSHLYTVPATGGESVRLSPDFTVGGGIFNAWAISPDSTRVVFVAKVSESAPTQLYSVPIEGGTVSQLSSPNADVGVAFISPDSLRIVYEVGNQTDDRYDLYSVPIDGGPVTALGISNVGLGLNEFWFSADGGHVLARTDANLLNGKYYSVPIDGGLVNELIVPATGMEVKDFKDSVDGKYFVYLLYQNIPDGIYSIPVEGGSSVKLNSPFNTEVTRVSIDSRIGTHRLKGTHLVYTVNYADEILDELYSVPIAGGSVTRLDAAPELETRTIVDWEYNLDSTRVLFSTHQEAEGVSELHIVAVEGGAITTLTAIQDTPNKIGELSISPDGKYVVYAIIDETGDRAKLEYLSVPIDGGQAVSLYTASYGSAPSWRSDSASQSPTFSPDGASILVRPYDFENDTAPVLFSVSIATGLVTNLNLPPVEGGAVNGFSISLDSTYAVYRSDQEIDGVYELYRVDLACTG
jgi:Tol biopolymer transport system component